jgi:hypothetical protein
MMDEFAGDFMSMVSVSTTDDFIKLLLGKVLGSFLLKADGDSFDILFLSYEMRNNETIFYRYKTITEIEDTGRAPVLAFVEVATNAIPVGAVFAL